MSRKYQKTKSTDTIVNLKDFCPTQPAQALLCSIPRFSEIKHPQPFLCFDRSTICTHLSPAAATHNIMELFTSKLQTNKRESNKQFGEKAGIFVHTSKEYMKSTSCRSDGHTKPGGLLDTDSSLLSSEKPLLEWPSLTKTKFIWPLPRPLFPPRGGHQWG